MSVAYAAARDGYITGLYFRYTISDRRDPVDSRVRRCQYVSVRVIRADFAKQRATVKLVDFPRLRARSVGLDKLW